MLGLRGFLQGACRAWLLGHWLYGKQYFTPEQARNHMLNIGGKANEVNVNSAVASVERGPIRHELDGADHRPGVRQGDQQDEGQRSRRRPRSTYS